VSEEAPESVNFRLEWRENRCEDPHRLRGDHYSAEVPTVAATNELVVEPCDRPQEGPSTAPPAAPGDTPNQAEAEIQAEESPEYFEWTEDRERAIQECLETTVEGTLPRVHLQLTAIQQALQHGNLAPQNACLLLDEIDAYLGDKILREEAKIPVAHPAFLSARADKLKALYSWQESSAALREFLAEGETVQMDVARYAADQASAFLAAARRELLLNEPEEDET